MKSLVRGIQLEHTDYQFPPFLSTKQEVDKIQEDSNYKTNYE
ncbi:MAG: hypothetical protein AAGJ93_03880 [Bacteroidota bacterium]